MGQLLAFPRMAQIKGRFDTREVWLNGRLLNPKESQKVWNHSPDGHNWGFAGSGPAQLALSVMLKFFPKEEALKLYQQFKFDVISLLPQSDFEITLDIDSWRKSVA